MEQAKRALHDARHEDAQALLINIIVARPQNEEAWLLLAESLTDPLKKRECLERARAASPQSPAIAHALAQLTQPAPAPEQTAPPVDESPSSPSKLPRDSSGEPAQVELAADSHVAAGDAPTRTELVAEAVPTDLAAADSSGNGESVEGANGQASAMSLAEPLLAYGEAIADAVVMTMEPQDTRNIGVELLRILDQALEQDPAETQRWARESGRTALVKYGKALTSLIAYLPRGDPQLSELLELRRRALEYLR